jgi:hypothetical protein
MINQTSLYIMVLAFLLLGGCTQGHKPLYTWGQYQPSLYAYYQKDTSTVQEQIIALKETLERSQAENRPVPPGFHAHLGLLHATLGAGDLARQEFITEKTLFPESEQYMDFLLSSKEQKQ